MRSGLRTSFAGVKSDRDRAVSGKTGYVGKLGLEVGNDMGGIKSDGQRALG